MISGCGRSLTVGHNMSGDGSTSDTYREVEHMSTVASTVGKFVWHEQVSGDPKQAQSFYTQLFGWGAEVFERARPTTRSRRRAATAGSVRRWRERRHRALAQTSASTS